MEFLLAGVRTGVTNVTVIGQRMVDLPPMFLFLAHPHKKWGHG